MYRAEAHFSLVCISGCFEYTYNPSGQLTSATCIALLDRAPCQATIKLKLLNSVPSQGRLKPGLHKVVTIAGRVAPKRILRLSIHRLQIFLVKYEYLRSVQLCGDQGISAKLKNVFGTICLRFFRLIWRPGFKDVKLHVYSSP